MADKDTRLKTGWYSYYRNEDINQDEGLCLLTEVRDFSYNYEGRNLLASCKQAEDYRKKAANWAKEPTPGAYGGPKVSEVCLKAHLQIWNFIDNQTTTFKHSPIKNPKISNYSV